MAREHRFTINLHLQPEGSYSVLVPALPEVVTCGDTQSEAVANAREAIELMLSVYRDDGRPIPQDVPTEIAHLIIAV